ncbi:Lactate utilization protein B [Geodia barretti]|uniref:Lactate utilization protein B n=1 Tax=Geodia barretti TaxID=519541 RepID=A0AA35T659_GEOBA|nr:Lactate utilization protein B [Geodia barretti]
MGKTGRGQTPPYEVKTKEFNEAAAGALQDEKIQANLLGLYGGFHQARLDAIRRHRKLGRAPGPWSRNQAHTLENLDIYLRMAKRNVRKAGGTVFFAKDSEEATRYVTELATSRGVKTVVKSKSMVSEEMGLNERLEEAGIESVETDLGEYIIQLAGEAPFHIIAPAIHKSREDVADLFEEKLNSPRYSSIDDLAQEARRQLRQKFITADMGITGANFIVAETGTLVLVTNEGNGRMCTSMPRIHVAITGMEKVVPSLEDMGIMLRIAHSAPLPVSASPAM